MKKQLLSTEQTSETLPTKSKAIILDTGTIITLSMNGLLYIIEELKKSTQTHFIITEQVKFEAIDRPLKVPRFLLGALRIKNLIENKTIELPQDLNIQKKEIDSITKKLMQIANSSITVSNKTIRIVSDAEMSCLALSQILTKKGTPNMIAVDERTTRILSEKPKDLEILMGKKLHTHVKLNPSGFEAFKQFKFLRSTELVYVAYKKGLLEIKGPKALEAVLFATKFKGSSVSFDEINVLKKL